MVAINFNQGQVPRNLLTFPVKYMYYSATLLPFSALVFVFMIGAVFHPNLLFDYYWMCGKVHLPSISRIINMPIERTVFQLLIMLDLPFRLFSLWYHAKLVTSSKDDFITEGLRYGMTISSITEITALSFLVTVGEHESGSLHVVFFCMFTISSFAYFLSHSLSLRFASDRTTMYEGGLNGRIASVLTLAVTLPLIFTFFTLYNGFCVPYTYELFALFEYITITAMLSYHATSYYQLCGKIMIVHPHKQKVIKL